MRKIKHFAGYGCVRAGKISREVFYDELVHLHIQVRGNHERGIDRDDVYDAVRWIGTRFDHELVDYRQVRDFHTEYYWDEATHEDICDYYFVYEKENKYGN